MLALRAAAVHGLRILNLSKTKPGVPGVKALVEAGGLRGLRMLDLSDNFLGPVAVKAIAECDRFWGLRVFERLSNNLVGDSGRLWRRSPKVRVRSGGYSNSTSATRT